MKRKQINQVGVYTLLAGLFLASFFHEWTVIIALLVGSYAGALIAYDK